MNDPLSSFRNALHNALPFVGVLLASWSIIAQFLDQVGVSAKVISAIAGALGVLSVLGSKYIDSASYTKIQTAQAVAAPPVVAQGPIQPPPAA